MSILQTINVYLWVLAGSTVCSISIPSMADEHPQNDHTEKGKIK